MLKLGKSLALIFFVFFLYAVPALAATSIPFTINVSKAVNVTGTPRIAVDVGGITRYATYTSGSGTSALTFTYAMVAGDVDLDGVTVSSPIDLNGGTIKDLSGNNLSPLTFTPPNTTNVKVNYPSLGMDFVADADGRYTLNGTPYNDLSSFLTAAGGSFTRTSIGTYFDSSGVLRTAASSVPRFDYDPVTNAAKGILIEESRTNLFLNSALLTNATWTARASTVTQNSGTSPDSSNTAFLINATNQYAAVYTTSAVSVSPSANYTISAFLKAGTLSTATLVIQGTNNVYGTYTLSGAGSISGGGGSGFTNRVPNISQIGNGWYRCSISFTVPSSGVTTVTPEIWVGNYNGTNNSGQTIYAWGAQLEQGAFPTSYIPTTSAAVTRAEDVLSIPTGTWFSTSEGAYYSNFYSTYNKFQTYYTRIIGDGAGASAFLGLSGNFTTAESWVGGSPIGANFSPAVSISTHVKAAISWNSNALTRSLVANGGAVSTGTYTGTYNSSSIMIGRASGQPNPPNTPIRSVKYYPLRVSDTQLQLLTQ